MYKHKIAMNPKGLYVNNKENIVDNSIPANTIDV